MWQIQVRVWTEKSTQTREWQSVRTSSGRVYEYPTEEEAELELRRFYPDESAEDIRAVEVAEWCRNWS